jgi:putative transposase
MEASDVKRLKELEEENARLKRMYADVSLSFLRISSQKKAGPCHPKTNST